MLMILSWIDLQLVSYCLSCLFGMGKGNGAKVPIISGIRDSGTATSVDQICVPSGLWAHIAHTASLRADHRLCMSCSVFANSNALPLPCEEIFSTLAMSAAMDCVVPENLYASLEPEPRR
jgi:hypothetical protein